MVVHLVVYSELGLHSGDLGQMLDSHLGLLT